MSPHFLTSYLALWILVIFQGLVGLALLRRLAELRATVGSQRIVSQDTPPITGKAPAFEGPDGRTLQSVSSADFEGRRFLILFLSGCEACVQLANDLRAVSASTLPPIVAFCLGGMSTSSIIVKNLAPHIHVILKDAEETAARYRISSVPGAMLVDGQGNIRSNGHPTSLADLMRLIPSDSNAIEIPEKAVEEVYPAIAR